MAAQTEECYNQCNADGSCNFFTLRVSRGVPKCYFLAACTQETDDVCIDAGTCFSGPNDCTSLPDNAPCPQIDPANTAAGKIHWQCTDIDSNAFNGYTATDISAGSECVLRCESWEAKNGDTAHLVSTCQDDGTWTATKASNAEETTEDELAFPVYDDVTGAYPKPDEVQTFACGCPDLHVEWTDAGTGDVFYYDPNTEPGTEFICEKAIDNYGEYVIETDNHCILFCDSYLVADVRCLNGEWTGEPDLGFWCYTEPSLDNALTTTLAPST